jgi:hypothetical protein
MSTMLLKQSSGTFPANQYAACREAMEKTLGIVEQNLLFTRSEP